MNALIIGGTSGLGLELAKKLTKTHSVFVTGRTDPALGGIHFLPLEIDSTSQWEAKIDDILESIGQVDTLIYAVGYFQDGRITDLTNDDIKTMMNVGVNAAMFVTKQLLERQERLPEFIAITSTSQWTPRLYEPVYTAAKAGLGAYANSLSLDERVKKTLVAGPAGMATNFWHDTDPKAHDTSKMLDPVWVADEIMKLRDTEAAYTFAKIMREPARVEITGERHNKG